MHARWKCPCKFSSMFFSAYRKVFNRDFIIVFSRRATDHFAQCPALNETRVNTYISVHTWKFMCSQSTSSRHWHDFLAMDLDGALKQHASRVVSFLGTISPLGRCSCAAALSSLVRSSNTMECFLLVPLPLTFSFFTTKSSPSGAGTGFNCSEDRM